MPVYDTNQNRIAERLNVRKDWFINRRLIVGLKRYDFTNEYFRLMKEVRGVWIESLERDNNYILEEATLWLLPTTDPEYQSNCAFD